MANPWFRMYSEFATDPKVQMLSEKDQRRYLMLLCLRCSNDDVTLHETEIAFQLRISDDELAATKVALMAKGLINEDFSPVAWEKRQYVSDSSTKRVAASRARKKQAVKPPCNVTVTPPDTDTDTDINPSLPAGAPAPPEFDPARLLAMHLDWQPDSKILPAYAKRAGIALENFTPEAIGQFAVHHTARQ
ncbi:MAG: DnaT-like ssDNA-binding domain-containing protein, partial [Pseudomonas sp.]